MWEDAGDPLDKPRSVSSKIDFHVPISFHSYRMVCDTVLLSLSFAIMVGSFEGTLLTF